MATAGSAIYAATALKTAIPQFVTSLSADGDPETYTGNATAPSLLLLLGLRPIAGRTFVSVTTSLTQRRWRSSANSCGRAASARIPQPLDDRQC